MADEKLEFECPNCGELVKVNQREFVDVSEDPDYKQKIIEGDFFLRTCRNCGEMIMVEYPMMYMDPERGLNIYLAPDDDGDLLEQLNSLEIPNPEDVTGKIFRLVTGGLELVEKILIAERGLDDRIIELYKFIIWDGVTEEWPELEPGDLVYMFDEDGDYIVIWPSDNGEDEKLSIEMDMGMYQELLGDYGDSIEVPAGQYAKVDMGWIEERFER